MSVNNDVISTIFQNISDLLEVKGENPFRIRAYRNAAGVIRGISETMAEMVEKANPGIRGRKVRMTLIRKKNRLICL